MDNRLTDKLNPKYRSLPYGVFKWMRMPSACHCMFTKKPLTFVKRLSSLFNINTSGGLPDLFQKKINPKYRSAL